MHKSQILNGNNFKNFLGSRVFTEPDSRTALPHLRPDEQVPLWKILKNFIGQDLTKVSLPVILNEPMTGIQRTAEATIGGVELLERAAQCKDSIKRLILATTGVLSAY